MGWNEADLAECSGIFIEELVAAFHKRSRDIKKQWHRNTM